MSIAPEKISIKRRRTEEPVEHLFYQSKKQKLAKHLFIRQTAANNTQSQARSVTAPQTTNGIPSIRTSQPGDEVKDFHKYREARSLPVDALADEISSIVDLSQGRKFHLTRDLSIAVRSNHASTPRPKSTIRPHLATFIERNVPTVLPQSSETNTKPPIDRVIRTDKPSKGEEELDQILAKDPSVQRKDIQPFAKPNTTSHKTGRSIKDDPSSWDLDSDELANELMALALDMDPDAKAAFEAETSQASDQMQIDTADEYIFETYIRVQQNAMVGVEFEHTRNFGILVIDEDEEELWDHYLREENEDDDDWDSEDEDSNAEDNPKNEYPDDEVSSDDESGNNAYKYRRGCSDDEQFDEDY